jgi:hypothetical protein
LLARCALAPALLSGALGACAGAAPAEASRYPEKKRPEPLRSASDGEVLGASQQSPEDTLEGSLTTGHAAPKGPRAETPEAEAQPPLGPDDCDEAPQRPPLVGSGSAQPKKKRDCPPPPPPASGD